MQTEEKEMTENEKKKEYLRQYRIHVRRIHRINAEIAELRSMKISPSMNNDGMPHGSSQGDLSGYAAELDRMVSELIKERYLPIYPWDGLVGDCREDEVFRTADLSISREGTGKFSASGKRCQ